ncbi:DUF368 domain-containing protein [Erysipelothrix larvae]|nr:DUF368 domain-containing protein [Erysipelothrix larvae]
MIDWILRFIKGVLIGSGFILPGVSGGALAAVFGVYQQIITFLAHITHNFKSNIIYFIPLGLGGISGVIFFSYLMSFFLSRYETQILWLFVGCILGTVPSLWKQAGAKGREKKHIIILILVFLISLMLMVFGETLLYLNPHPKFSTWIIVGVLIGLGLIIPGLSPTNLIVYLGLYKHMTDGLINFDLMIIIPILIGTICTVLLLSKMMNFAFNNAHTVLFHCILGIILASTLMIMPQGFSTLCLESLVLLFAGSGFGYWMCTLQKEHDIT